MIFELDFSAVELHTSRIEVHFTILFSASSISTILCTIFWILTVSDNLDEKPLSSRALMIHWSIIHDKSRYFLEWVFFFFVLTLNSRIYHSSQSPLFFHHQDHLYVKESQDNFSFGPTLHSDAFWQILVHWGLDKPLLKIHGVLIK